MYDVKDSMYTYKGTNVLKNRLNIMDEDLLLEYQTKMVSFKLSTIHYLKIDKSFDDNKLKLIHKYLFEDIYDFAGKYRKENIIKGEFRFSEYEYIDENIRIIMKKIDIKKLKIMNLDDFAKSISSIMTDLNVLHPFREGNGRVIREFVRQICLECGYKINFSNVPYDEILQASIEAVVDETKQIQMLKKMLKNNK